jgi:hypothetical protein
MKSEVIIGSDLKESLKTALEVGTSWAAFLKAHLIRFLELFI